MIGNWGTLLLVDTQMSGGGLFRQARPQGLATETSKIEEISLKDLGLISLSLKGQSSSFPFPLSLHQPA
jgi:hypothetical protein